MDIWNVQYHRRSGGPVHTERIVALTEDFARQAFHQRFAKEYTVLTVSRLSSLMSKEEGEKE